MFVPQTKNEQRNSNKRMKMIDTIKLNMHIKEEKMRYISAASA